MSGGGKKRQQPLSFDCEHKRGKSRERRGGEKRKKEGVGGRQQRMMLEGDMKLVIPQFERGSSWKSLKKGGGGRKERWRLKEDLLNI